MDTLSPRLKKLDRSLAQLQFDREAMMLSELDGYLAGILVCPDLIMLSEWLPGVWSDPDEDEPAFDDFDDLRELIDQIMKHYNAISRGLQRDVARYEAIYDVDTRHDPSLPLAFKLARVFDNPIEDIFDD